MKELIIVGAGGFGRELLQWVKDINAQKPTWKIKGFLDDNPDALKGIACDYEVMGSIVDWNPSPQEEFACAIAAPDIKEKVVMRLKGKGAQFATIIHPTARIAEFVELGEGFVAYPGAGVHPNATVGAFVTLLTMSTIGHDAEVGDFCTTSSYCDITGGVRLEDHVFLGSSVAIVPGRKIGRHASIAAGSVVITNVREGTKVMGNPAQKYAL